MSEQPWKVEPTKWDGLYEGLPCQARRGPSSHWCGYVGVPPEHPAYGADYNDVEADVHGGLTFAGTWDDSPGYWWFGFDCAHLGDFVPGLDGLAPQPGDTYRDLNYVQAECARLAAQLVPPLKVRRWRIES